MTDTAWILIALGAIVVIALIVLAVYLTNKKRSEDLRHGFGAEYDRTVEETGDRKEAESELRERRERRETLQIRPLDPSVRDKYLSRWEQVEQSFVEVPGAAVADAQRLVDQLMAERGYPVDDFDQRAADISVDHPAVVENYRRAHAVTDTGKTGSSSVDDLRDAMINYRSLFNALLETEDATPTA